MKSKFRWIYFTAIILMVVGLTGIIASAIIFTLHTTPIQLGNKIDTSIWSNYGGFVGGSFGSFLSLSGLLLILFNIHATNKGYSRDKLESRFFEMLEFHRSNSEKIVLHDGAHGNQAFVWLVEELGECIRICRKHSASFSSEKDLLNTAFHLFYFGGHGDNSVSTIRSKCSEFAPVDTLLSEIASERSGGPSRHCLFDGHQHRLGHYFRNLYQTVTFVNAAEKDLLSYKEKYQLVKLLRGQLSTHEQILLFFNSFFTFGRNWEFNHDEPNNKLITKYNLIRNVDTLVRFGVKLNEYYPDVRFEISNYLPRNRLLLESRYC